jgi:predicted HTH domain antitoxin
MALNDGTTTMATVHLDNELVEAMRLTDEPIDSLAQTAIVLELYRRGAISSARAGALLGMDRLEFIQYSGRLGIPYFDTTDEEWAAELRVIRSS